MKWRLFFLIAGLMLLATGVSAQTDALTIDIDNATEIELLTSINAGTAVTLGWSPDGVTLAVATETQVLLYDSRDWTLAPRELPSAQVISMVFSPNGQSIATSSSFGGDGIVIWDLKTSAQLASFQDIQPNMMGNVPAVALAFSPDGKLLATQHYLEHLGILYDPWVRLWNAQTGKLLTKIDGGGMTVAFSPNGQLLVADTRATVRVWSIDRILNTSRNDILLEDLVLNGSGILGFSANSNQLAYLRDGRVQIWDIAAQQIVNRAGADKALCVAKTPFPFVVNQYQTQEYSVQLWDGCQNQLLATLDGYTKSITAAVFNPAKTLLATVSQDGVVRLWGIPAN